MAESASLASRSQRPHVAGRIAGSDAVRQEALCPAEGVDSALRRDRAAVEISLRDIPAAGRVVQVAQHAVKAGGKRLRPLLTCAVMRALGADPGGVIDLVAAVELAHTGSLLHDDILDGARTRRGAEAAHVAFDVPAAILAGDLLLAVAVERVACRGPRALGLRFGESVRALCEGAVRERERLFDATVDLAHTRWVNRRKTAVLIEYAAEAGAILARAPDEIRAAARRFGAALGEAFQTADDLLDLEGDPARLGKPVGQDLLGGTITVPVAIALERDPGLRSEILTLWNDAEGAGRELPLSLRRRIASSGALDAARTLAARDVERARAALEHLPAGAWTRHLALLASLVARRDR